MVQCNLQLRISVASGENKHR